MMSAASFDVSVMFPEVLGELPFFCDQDALSDRADSTFPRTVRYEDNDFGLLVCKNGQVLWATLGTWVL
jgi:hypothetical protein